MVFLPIDTDIWMNTSADQLHVEVGGSFERLRTSLDRR
jgi:hypothetical protein